MRGRRRPDAHVGELPDDIQPGDYWRALIEWRGQEPTNLTGLCYYIVAPESGFGIALLTKHTIREEEDGTIRVRPGDGSSNSILVHGANGKTWHGYIEHGVWSSV